MITKRISAPYSFVPLNKDVYIPAWYNKVSQDIPFEDGEDGIIEVKWRNVSPLIIRDGSCGKSEVAQSVFVDMPDGTRRYFIPGSSIKGMLRNVMAIMSFGKFNSFTDRKFGYRDIRDSKYRTKMVNVCHGWLQKSGKDYILYPCKGEVEKIDIKEVEALYPKYDNNNDKNKSAWKRNKAIGNNSFPEIERHGITYRLFATGMMNKKLDPRIKDKPEKKAAYVPEELKEIMDALREYITEKGIAVDQIIGIQYGQKIRCHVGVRKAEVNLFYGKHGFSIVQSPRTGTDGESNELLADSVRSFLVSKVTIRKRTPCPPSKT